MNRTQLFGLAHATGWRKNEKASANVKQNIKKKLEDYFDTPEGQALLKKAPRCVLYDSDGRGYAPGKDLVIKQLLREFEGDHIAKGKKLV